MRVSSDGKVMFLWPSLRRPRRAHLGRHMLGRGGTPPEGLQDSQLLLHVPQLDLSVVSDFLQLCVQLMVLPRLSSAPMCR